MHFISIHARASVIMRISHFSIRWLCRSLYACKAKLPILYLFMVVLRYFEVTPTQRVNILAADWPFGRWATVCSKGAFIYDIESPLWTLSCILHNYLVSWFIVKYVCYLVLHFSNSTQNCQKMPNNPFLNKINQIW